MQERELDDLKANKFFARIYHYTMVSVAVVSSSEVFSCIPLVVMNALPMRADIALVGGGVLVASTSIIETSRTYKWKEKAKQLVKDWEQNNKR